MVNTRGWTSDQHFEWRKQNLAGAVTLATEAIKALILVNGGACIATIAFLGNIAGKIESQPWAVAQIGAGLHQFGSGVLAATFCAIFAYLSQRVAATWEIAWVELTFAFGALACAGLSAWLFADGMGKALAVLI